MEEFSEAKGRIFTYFDMKVEELRIGNYIKFDNTIFIVTLLHKDDNNLIMQAWSNVENMGLRIDYHLLKEDQMRPEPIIITDELLLKCRFNGYYLNTEHGYINYDFGRRTFHIGGYDSESTGQVFKTKPMYYLHQLQNLFYNTLIRQQNSQRSTLQSRYLYVKYYSYICLSARTRKRLTGCK